MTGAVVAGVIDDAGPDGDELGPINESGVVGLGDLKSWVGSEVSSRSPVP